MAQFAQAMGHFRALVEALTTEKAPGGKVAWTLDDLAAGSALATVRGVAERPEVVESVTAAYVEVGRYLSRHEVAPFSEKVQRAAHSLGACWMGR